MKKKKCVYVCVCGIFRAFGFGWRLGRLGLLISEGTSRREIRVVFLDDKKGDVVVHDRIKDEQLGVFVTLIVLD